MSLGKSTSTSATKLNQISVQSATMGKPIALGWGRGRLSCNLIWYNGFKAISHTTKSGGGKGMGGSSNTTYTYTASVIMALCEGTVSSISTVYRDTSVFSSLAAAGLSLANGSATQPVWGYLTSRFPSEALAYSGIAYVYAQDYALSDSATLPNHSFEVNFALQGPGGVPDANPKDIITDFLTSTAHGVPGWGSGLLGDLTDYGNYCLANNLLLSPVLDSQQRASSTIEEWLTATNSAAFWSEGVLKIRPYGDAAATGNGVTWTPDLSPEYDLTENDFQADPDGAVKLDIKDQSDAYNVVQFEFFDRSHQYNAAIATAQDLSNIIDFGQRKQDQVTVHAICDAAIAQKAVQLYLQRVLYVRETYTFRLPWSFVLLEPMDLVTLTTSADELQLNRQLVRIIEIEEDEDGLLTFTAEGVDAGVAGAAQYASHSGDGYIGNTDIAPGSVSSPALFVPPVGLTGFDPEVWCAVASTSATWGGCEVWVSADGTNYSRAGRIDGPARYGVLAAALPSHDDPDNASTLSVNLATSLGALDGGTAAEMNAAATLAIIDGELISYQNATLTGAYAYNLSPLRRGLNGTAPAAHASGATFIRLDDAIFKLNYASLNIGETIWVKFPSFNLWGKGLQDLSTVSAYSITVPSADTRYSQALSDITAISSDSILAHGSEKQQAYIDYQALLNDYNALSAQYATKGNPSSVTSAASDAATAMTALTNYLAGLSPSWTDTSSDTPIVAATWTSTWGAAYNKVATFRAVLTGQDAINNVNRVRNSQFELGVQGWRLPYVQLGLTINTGFPQVIIQSGFRALKTVATASAAGQTFFVGMDKTAGYVVPVTAGERLAVQVTLGGEGVIGSQQLALWWIDADGSETLGNTVIGSVSGTFALGAAVKGFATVPAGATAVRLELYAQSTGAGAFAAIIAQPMITSARAGQTEFPYFTPGVADGASGAAGINTATINIFQRGATAPALPSATTTYDFSAKTLTGLNNGWSTSLPSGTAPLWQSAATAAGQGTTDTIAPSEWASAVQIAANGADAASSAPIILYKRTSTSSAPAVPTSTVTYTFGTATAAGMNNGWTQSLPASGGAYRWQINATAVSTSGTDTIAPSEWSAPNIMAQDGSDGAPAINNINRLRNTQFEQGLRGWTTPLVSGATIDAGYPLTGIASGYRYYRAWFTASAAGSAVSIGNDFSGGYEIPVIPLELLSVQSAVELQGPANIKLVIWWIDGSGSTSATDVALATGSQPLGTIIGGVVQVPAGYTRARIELYATATEAGHISLIVTRPMVASAISGQTALPPFTPGTADAADGAAGINTATINVFQRATTAPALPSAPVTYNFATASTTGLNNGWSTSIPAGTSPLWQSAATAASQSATDTIAASEWASAVQIAANGSSAASSAPVLLYNRTTTPSAPAVPSTTVTYDFGTAVATGMNNGWSQSLPATGGAYRWQINATAVSTTGTDTIAPSEWSAPNIMAQDGANGAPGASTAQLTIYQRASSAPALPSVTATYDFSAKSLSGLNNGWSATIPAGTDPVYTAQALASSTGTTASIAPGDWSTPVNTIQNGQDSTTARATLSVTDDGIAVTGTTETTIATATIALTAGGHLKVSGGVFGAVGSNDNIPGGSTQTSFAALRLKVAGTTIATGTLSITADGIVTGDPIVGWSGQLLSYSASGSVTVSLTRQRSGPASSGGATYSANLLLEAVT